MKTKSSDTKTGLVAANGFGELRAILEKACTETSCSLNALTVLSPQIDVYRLDTPSGHRDGQWVGEQYRRLVKRGPDPNRALNRRFRFTLLGGGQITIIERFRPWILTQRPEPEFYCERRDLHVTADAGKGLRHFSGVIGSVTYEMGAKAALFLPGTPQSIADRVATTFRLLTCARLVGTNVRGPDPDNFAALLDRSEQCCVCGRALRDHVSTLLGIGPTCAKQMQLPHGLTVADKIQQRRRELLGES
jgi:hypothetical protein